VGELQGRKGGGIGGGVGLHGRDLAG
jgi:hypothetical protein